MRCLGLYLTARRMSWALTGIVMSAAVAWMLFRFWGDSSTTMFIEFVIPLVPAVVIGVSTGSPFGETEHTASRALFALRLAHLGGLLVCAVVALSLASLGAAGVESHWVLVRNLAGYTGLACLGSRFTGPAFASVFGWALPIGYVAVTWAIEDTLHLAWAKQAPADHSASIIAGILLALGIAAVLPGSDWRRSVEGDMA